MSITGEINRIWQANTQRVEDVLEPVVFNIMPSDDDINAGARWQADLPSEPFKHHTQNIKNNDEGTDTSRLHIKTPPKIDLGSIKGKSNDDLRSETNKDNHVAQKASTTKQIPKPIIASDNDKAYRSIFTRLEKMLFKLVIRSNPKDNEKRPDVILNPTAAVSSDHSSSKSIKDHGLSNHEIGSHDKRVKVVEDRKGNDHLPETRTSSNLSKVISDAVKIFTGRHSNHNTSGVERTLIAYTGSGFRMAKQSMDSAIKGKNDLNHSSYVCIGEVVLHLSDNFVLRPQYEKSDELFTSENLTGDESDISGQTSKLMSKYPLECTLGKLQVVDPLKIMHDYIHDEGLRKNNNTYLTFADIYSLYILRGGCLAYNIIEFTS